MPENTHVKRDGSNANKIDMLNTHAFLRATK